MHPSVICLQETLLKESKRVTFKGFSLCHNFASEINGIAHGGTAILINSSIPYRKLDLQTNVQAVAVRVPVRKL